MRNYFIAFLFIFCNLSAKTQGIFNTVSGEISFFSEAPLENIHAVNKEPKSLINSKTGEIAVVVAIRKFKFAKPLMEEHFNENYLESEKYKSSVFKGKINENLDFSKNGIYQVSATGVLDIHGVKQNRTITGTLEIKDSGLVLDSKFDVALKDHKIKIPKAVLKNIAEIIEVRVLLNYEPKKQE